MAQLVFREQLELKVKKDQLVQPGNLEHQVLLAHLVNLVIEVE